MDGPAIANSSISALAALDRLAERLETLSPLHPDDEHCRREAHFKKVYADAMARGRPWGSPGGPSFLTLNADTPDNLKPDQVTLREQIQAVDAAVDYYLATGREADCILPTAISKWLRNQGESRRELRFLVAFNRHFGSRYGTINSALLNRMIELQIESIPGFDYELAFCETFVKHLAISITDFHSMPHETGRYHFNFAFMCKVCGGFLLHLRDDADEDAMVLCTACGIPFGTFANIKSLCRHLGRNELKRVGLAPV